MDLQIINKKGYNDRSYIAGFDGKKVGLYAPSLLAAKQKAVEHFRPKKTKASLVWVELADTEDE